MKLLPDSDPSADVLLGIYLQDHLTAATGGLELFKRSAKGQLSPTRRVALSRLTDEVREDRDALVALMQRLGVAVQPHRVAAGWVAEKVVRAKLNGTLLRRSPLSDVIELDGMLMGVQGKAGLWRLLQSLATTDDRLDRGELERLAGRAQAQLDELEQLRTEASAALRR